jgi:50S ribosomal protein L16 3-hydroxylase
MRWPIPIIPHMTVQVLRRLGALPIARFMREAWQRKPLLVRAAIPDFVAPVARERLFELAASEQAEARLIECRNGEWTVRHGPFKRLPSTRRREWTVLLQGVDLLDESAHALLQRFRFVPDARLDDIMVSYASDGGGVGPHVDAYDVFLLQSSGCRRWRISRQHDHRMIEDAPLRILANFRPTDEFMLEPGDLLYLPPGVAHEGTAIGECITCSIGFRAFDYQELLEPYLAEFAAHAAAPGRYADAEQPATRRPSALPSSMRDRVHRMLNARRPSLHDTARFLLTYLSEPKAQVIFERPLRALRRATFDTRVRSSGVRLDRRTRFLYDGPLIGINGECERVEPDTSVSLHRLADTRGLPPGTYAEQLLDRLHEWYLAGWLRIAPAGTSG